MGHGTLPVVTDVGQQFNSRDLGAWWCRNLATRDGEREGGDGAGRGRLGTGSAEASDGGDSLARTVNKSKSKGSSAAAVVYASEACRGIEPFMTMVRCATLRYCALVRQEQGLLALQFVM